MFLGHVARRSVSEKVRLLFGGVPSRTQVAALPWRAGDDGVEIMLVTSRGTGRWVLPKGWPEGDEDLWQAAAREAAEEAGVDGEMSSEPIGSYYYMKSLPRGAVRRCEVHVYPLRVEDMARKWPEKKARTRRWLKPSEAAALVAEPDLAELLATFRP